MTYVRVKVYTNHAIPPTIQRRFLEIVYAYQYAAFYARRGDNAKALEWLETALRLRDAGLENLKTDPLIDPLRNEARFQAVMRALKFPG